MAKEGKKSFVTKYIEAKIKFENEKRKTPSGNYFGLFKDVLKSSLSGIIYINILIILFLVPSIFIIYYKSSIINAYGAMLPFASNIGIGYPSVTDLTGVTESLTYITNLQFNALLVLSSLIIAISLSGGMYLTRKNVLGTPAKAFEFFKGVKSNYLPCLFATVFFLAFYLLSSFLIDYANFMIVTKPDLTVILTISKVAAYFFLAFAFIMSMWMISMGVSYKLSIWALLKNSFLMTIGFFHWNIIFGGIILIPAYFLLSSSFIQFGLIVYAMLGVALSMLIWMCYSQWAFDKYFPKFDAEPANKFTTIQYSFDENGRAKAEINTGIKQVLKTKFDLASRPIKSFDDDLVLFSLPQSFKRNDLLKLNQSKNTIIEDNNNYVNEHKNDQVFIDYNKQFEIVNLPTSKKAKKLADKKDFIK